MMEAKLLLRIFTPEELREETVDAVLLPGAFAPLEVLPSHAPLTAALCEGEIRWRSGAQEERYAIRGGAVSIAKNIVTICVEKA